MTILAVPVNRLATVVPVFSKMAVNSVSDDPIVSYDCGALKLCRDDQGALNIKNGTGRCGCRLGSSICGLLSDGNGCLQIARLDRGGFLGREPEPLRRASEDPSENEDTCSGDGYDKFKRVRRSGVPKGTNGIGYVFSDLLYILLNGVGYVCHDRARERANICRHPIVARFRRALASASWRADHRRTTAFSATAF